MADITPDHIIKKVLSRAKEHVQNGDYNDARKLIMKVNHPKRDAWLANIDKQEKLIGKPKNKSKKKEFKEPTLGPGWWAGMSIIMSPLIAGIVLGWGWRRFGRKQWVLPTILAAILLIALGIGTGIGTALFIRSTDNPTSNLWYFLPAIIILAASYGFPFFIAGRQTKALKIGKEKGQLAMEAHQYDWGYGLLMWFLNMVVILGIAGFSFWSSSGGGGAGTQTFESNTLSFEYPSGWQTIEPTSIPECTDPNVICEFAGGTRFGEVAFFIFTPAVQQTTSSEFVDNVWTHFADSRVDRGTVEFKHLAGRYVTVIESGYYQTFYALPKSQHLLIVGFVASDEATMQRNQDKINNILNSLIYAP